MLRECVAVVLQGVTMVVQELCRQLPMIDFQNTAQLLAVGVPGANAASPLTTLWGQALCLQPDACSIKLYSCLRC